MDWVKLGVRYYLDPKIRGIDGDLADAAEVMFTRGIARAGEVGQGGFIPERDVPLLTRRRRYAAVVRVLTDSGLWTAVPGGYQVKRWSGWQEHLDALTRKRAADRDRQRARRAAANGESTSRYRHPPNASRDPSRDVTAAEGEGELEGVQLGGLGTTSESTAPPPPVENQSLNGKSPPPWRCPQHADAPAPGPCGPCGDYRRARQDWERRHVAAAQQRDHAERESPKCDNCGNRTNTAYHRNNCAKGAP